MWILKNSVKYEEENNIFCELKSYYSETTAINS